MAPMDTIQLLSVLMQLLSATSWLPTTPTLHPYKSACGISYARKNYLKWQAIQLAIHSSVGEQIAIDDEELQNRGKLHASICFRPEIDNSNN